MENQKSKNKDKQSNMPIGPGRMSFDVQKAKDFKTTIKNLVQYLHPFRVALAFVLVFAMASTVFTIVSPKILGNMTNQVISDYKEIKIYEQNINSLSSLEKPTINFTKLGHTAFFLIIIFLLSSLFTYIQGWIMADVTQKITYKFRKDISIKINRLPLKYFDKTNHGDIMSRVINDVDNISQTLNQSLTQILTSFTLVIGILIMMLSINWIMTIVALLTIPLSFFAVSKIIKKSQKHFKRQQISLGQINGHIEEMYSGHTVMKVFNGEEDSLKKFRKINDEMFDSALKSQFFSSLMHPIMHFMANLGFVGVSVTGAWLALRGSVRIGDIQAFIQYVRQFNQPILQIANVANVLQSTAASAERVFEFLAETEEIINVDNPTIIKNISGQVDFDNVYFGYDQNKPVIKNLNVSIKPGQRVAIVGPTGAGKTTIVNLLMRFYDIDQGCIKVDGIDIRQIKRSQLRQIFGMVLQDTWLFQGTIRDNIAYANTKASDQEIKNAAIAAHADQIIHTFPQGYDMKLNEDADNISQGEKQLITIARAMLADPAILILDEATSSVDTRTEVLIQEAMDKLMKNRTSFIIAHRLSTIRDADLILVMRDGQVIEQGKHSELLEQKGFYASLYNSQFTTNS